MPVYEYKCDSCGAVFEVIQKFSDEPLKIHKNCGGRLERLISPPALQFKGTGWYITDYARNSGPSSRKNGGGGKERSQDASSSDNKDASAAKRQASENK